MVRARSLSLPITRLSLVRNRATRTTCVLLIIWIGMGASGLLQAKTIHNLRLRLLDRRLEPLVETGLLRSETFRALVERLDRGDVVVYVRHNQLPERVHGRLIFLSAAAGVRYVLVELTDTLDQARTIVMLGHELRHAIEILEQPQIVDRSTFVEAYERAASTRRQFDDGALGYDTRAAVLTGVQVWKELSGRRLAASLGTR